MGDRYECKLPSDVLKKAIDQLNEPQDNDTRLAEIDKLKTRFEEQSDMELIQTDDLFFLRFLRAKKFNQEKAYNMLLNYHVQRRDFREVFDKVDNPELLGDMLKHGACVPIKRKAEDGSTVVIGQPGIGMQDTAQMIDFLALIVLTIEHLLTEDEGVTVHGMTVIVDYSYFNFNLLKQFTPSFGKRFGGVMSEAMPARLKSMNVVNEYKIFTIIYNIMKPFTKPKMQRRLELHGSNFTNLHKKVDPAGLPPFLAGTGPDLDTVGWKNRLFSSTGHGQDTAL